jgi:hypothetical protein
MFDMSWPWWDADLVAPQRGGETPPTMAAARGFRDDDRSDAAGQRVRQEDGGSKDGDEFVRVSGATSDSLPFGIDSRRRLDSLGQWRCVRDEDACGRQAIAKTFVDRSEIANTHFVCSSLSFARSNSPISQPRPILPLSGPSRSYHRSVASSTTDDHRSSPIRSGKRMLASVSSQAHQPPCTAFTITKYR